jgi:hypothetical protein
MTSDNRGRAHAERCGLTWGLLALALLAGHALGQPPVANMAFESPQFGYRVTLPTGCRLEEGPGTLDAICSPRFEAEESAQADATAALVLEIVVEPVPEDVGKPAAQLALNYGEGEFKQELPEAVCGEGDPRRVKIENLKQVVESTAVVYSAQVSCAEVKFLGLASRRALAQTHVMAGLRYRLFARALQPDFELNKDTIEAFLSSFAVISDPNAPGGAKSP